MNIYILDHWVPFPSSEMGGLIVAIATNREELKTLLQDDADPYYLERFSEELEEVVSSATKYPLCESQEYSPGIVKSFLT